MDLNLSWNYSRNQERHSAYVSRLDKFFIISPEICPVTKKKKYGLYLSTNEVEKQKFIITGKTVKMLKILTMAYAEKLKAIAEIDDSNAVYDLEPEEKVTCFFCMESSNYQEYGRGDAFLAGPGHSPFNGSANHVCKNHLAHDAVIHHLPDER
ncbi:MAG: hypothetical protein ACTS9Y_00340 [Methylophilus sp.]|uniref:hypothetical protein n=1 Tax=Methylophilus sp. TaxID=29541 RepID=UPI003F9FC462